MDREVLSFARGASSISEIVANLIKEIQNEFDQDVATNLLMGIHEGTRNFSHPEVSADTFLVAAELMKSGGKHIHKDRIERRNYPHGAIPLEKPSVEATKTPQSWLEPKIFKGTSIS
jgi:nanoRNase/pAp phosphatase (c-di-AMP/oligoRNAs hydrolase)